MPEPKSRAPHQSPSLRAVRPRAEDCTVVTAAPKFAEHRPPPRRSLPLPARNTTTGALLPGAPPHLARPAVPAPGGPSRPVARSVASLPAAASSAAHALAPRVAPPPPAASPRVTLPPPPTARPSVPAFSPPPVEAHNVIPITKATRASSVMRAVSQAPEPTFVDRDPLAAHAAPAHEEEPSTAPMPPPFPGDGAFQYQPLVENPDARWAIFTQLGLGPPPIEDGKKKRAKLLVDSYRALGFGILSIIVIVLVGYIATSAFYFVSDSWIQPMKVSKTDEKVLALQAEVATQENARDRIITDLNHADRYIAVQQTFQAQFADAIRADLEGRKNALGRARDMAQEYAGARTRIQKQNAAYASASRKRMAEEYAAGLIDRGEMLSGKQQLASLASSNLSLAERQSEYEARTAELEAEAQALDAILTEKGGAGALSYDVLRIKQEYEMSRLETAKAIENREALRSALTRQDEILGGLHASPYLRAAQEGANVAFVPYGNMDNVKVGSPLYSCMLEMLICSKAGKVSAILPGEVTFKHPHREKVLRGQMIEVQLDDSDAAEEDVLFVGGKPLLL